MRKVLLEKKENMKLTRNRCDEKRAEKIRRIIAIAE
jgi:hypothetical protein